MNGAQTPTNGLSYISPPGTLTKTNEIEEETKEESAGNNDELFKHLSYLSQLSNDVSKHQQVEQAGPGEYKIKLFDASSASPASAKLRG